MTQDWTKLAADLEGLLKLRAIPFGMKLFEPFPQYGIRQDVRTGMAVSYPGRAS